MKNYIDRLRECSIERLEHLHQQALSKAMLATRDAEIIKNVLNEKYIMPQRYKCKHCGMPIRITPDGIWVHDDPDEDPKQNDYGWVKCSGETTEAEPSK